GVRVAGDVLAAGSPGDGDRLLPGLLVGGGLLVDGPQQGAGGALNGDGLEVFLRQLGQLRQVAHVIDGLGHLGVQGVGDDIHRTLLFVHQHIVAVAVRSGVAQGDGQRPAVRLGCGQGGEGLVQAIGLQRIALCNGLLGFEVGEKGQDRLD
ncbi:hypothetical protein EJMLMN_EJMLMN_14870, partial [Dysosmobacter welbionis]